MKFFERLGLIIIVLLLSVGCDQGTKALAEEHLANRGTISLLGDTVRLHYAENQGAILSLGARLPAAARFWIFTVFVGAVLVVTLLYLFRDGDLGHGQVVALSLILGGGVSNLIDRIMNDGAVIDFLNIGISNLRTGIFNVADIAVFAGVGLFWLYYAQRQEPDGKSELSPDDGAGWQRQVAEIGEDPFDRRILSNWADYFGCSVADLRQPDTVLVPRERRAPGTGVHIWYIDEHAFVEVDHSLVDAIKPALQDLPAGAVLTPQDVQAALGPERVAELTTGLVCYLQTGELRRPEVDGAFEIRQLTPADAEHMETLHNASPAADVEEAFVEVDHLIACGAFAGDQLVAAASGYVSRGFLDLGVLTHPDFRQQGLGKAVTAELCCWAFDRNMIPQYRHEAGNAASRGVAEALGFTPYFKQESVWLKK